MKRFLIRIVLAAAAAISICGGIAQATTLTGTFNNDDGTAFNGVIYFSLPSSVTVSSASGCPGPVFVPNTYSVGIQIVNGAPQGSVNLYDSNCINPAGLAYNVQIVSSTGVSRSQQWVVTGSTQNVGSIVPIAQGLFVTSFVSQIICGSGMTCSPTNGIGIVTLTSAGGGGGGSAAFPSTAGIVYNSNTSTSSNATSAQIVAALNNSPSTLFAAGLLPKATYAAYGAAECDNVTITCPSGVMTLASGQAMVWPGATGIMVYAGGSAYGTSIAAPASAIAGISDTQALTNKTLDGVTPATMAYVDPTSSIQTQINGKQASLGYTPAHSGANSDILSLAGMTTPLPVSEGGTGTASPGLIAGSNIAMSGTWPNQTITAILSGSTGYTPVITIANADNTLSYAKAVCVVGNCAGGSPGGTNAPSATSQTTGTLTSPPTTDTAAMTLSETTLTSSTQTNTLWTNIYGTCDACTQLTDDFYFQTDANVAHASQFESDMAIFDRTDLLDFMFGLQCNQATGLWQIDNQSDPWVNTSVVCSLSANTWYHVIYKAHRVIGDTSCTGGMPCEYFDSLTINGTTYTLNQTMRATALPSTWAGVVLDQKQINIGSTTTAQTVTEKITANNFTASTGSATTGVTNGVGNVGNLLSYNFDGPSGVTGLTATGAPVLATTNIYTSPYSVHFPTGNNFYTATFSGTATIYTRQYVQVNTVGSTTNEILDLYNGSSEQYTLYLSNTNFLSYYNENTSSGGTVSGSALPTGSYVCIEMYWTAGASTGAVTIKVNGVTVYTATGINTGTIGVNKALFGQANTATGWDTNMDNVDFSSTSWLGAVTLTSVTGARYSTYGTLTDCNSTASPAVCGSAAAGTVNIAAGSTSVVVNSSAVTAISEIKPTFDSSLGAKLGVTCNTTYAAPWVSARTAGTSFTITVGSAPTTNPACYSYTIFN